MIHEGIIGLTQHLQFVLISSLLNEYFKYEIWIKGFIDIGHIDL